MGFVIPTSHENKIRILAEQFAELLQELESESHNEAVASEWGTGHHKEDLEKTRMQLIGLYNGAIGNNPGEVCQNCDGTGVCETSDSVDYGSTTVQMRQSFQCDTLADGHCCKCGGNVDSGYSICEGCGEDWSEKYK